MCGGGAVAPHGSTAVTDAALAAAAVGTAEI
jgi:hypothetical protein